MPPNTVSVARPGFWGNPYRVVLDALRDTGEDDEHGNPIIVGPWLCESPRGAPTAFPVRGGYYASDRDSAVKQAVAMFRLRLERLHTGATMRERISELRGKNLACWCPLDAPCHADVLIEFANREPDA